MTKKGEKPKSQPREDESEGGVRYDPSQTFLTLDCLKEAAKRQKKTKK
jgi:hypothetical protein